MPFWLTVSAIKERYRNFFASEGWLSATALSALLFAASLVVQYYAIVFATARASNSVTDIILSNIPVFDIGYAYVYGTFAVIFFIVILTVLFPRRIPMTLFSVALFYFIRSFFVSLTHLAPYPLPPDPEFGKVITKIFFGKDRFFSGHTGLPFLMALLYWKEPALRNAFLSLSVFFAVVVLLSHLHYSIDVFAAYFITYAIFHLAIWLFPKSRALFVSDDPLETKAV